MLKSISIENYKCFKPCTTIELAPLTILCGVNSSGKSSIINSLLMAKQSYENSSIENKLELNGKYIKSGSYEDIVYKKEGGRIVFKIGYELTPPSKKRNIKKTKNEITAFKALTKMFSKIVDNIVKFRIDTETIIDKAVDDKQINNDILSEQNISIKIYNDKGVQSIEPTIHLKNLQDKQYRMTLHNIPNDTALCEKVVLSDCVCYFEGFKLINAFAYNVGSRVNNLSEILANIYLIFSFNAMQYRSIHYLNPLREYPKMNYNIDNEINSVGLGGEYVPHFMYLHENQNILAFLPDNNGESFLKQQKTSFQTSVQIWMNYLGFGKYSFEKNSKTLSMEVGKYNIVNVGFGISQVLPIIASGLLLKGGETLLVEQPEIHLHPKAQMCIADFLLATVLRDKSIIVETHSDHIINRVIRRMMEDRNFYKRVKILFVDQDENGDSHIEEVKIDPIKGALIENENFFYQFADETEKIIAVGYRNKKKKDKAMENK